LKGDNVARADSNAFKKSGAPFNLIFECAVSQATCFVDEDGTLRMLSGALCNKVKKGDVMPTLLWI
jgi:uncharacterized cupin superfamily protein